VRQEIPLTTGGLAVAGTLVASGVAILLLSYLRGEISIGAIDSIVSPSEQSSSREIEFLSGIQSRVTAALTKVQQDLADLKSTRPSAVHVDAESIRDAIRDDVVGDVAARLDQRYAQAAIQAAHVAQVRRNFDEAFLRLRNEVAALTRRGNLNLVIGTLTTTAAVGLLLYMLFPNQVLSSWTALLSHYVPRLTTVIFIEIFAFFFLRLYKSSLGEIQYYQNELTTLALQWNAFELAVAPGEKPMSLVEQFASADRNRSLPAAPDNTAPDLTAADLLKKVAHIVAAATNK